MGASRKRTRWWWRVALFLPALAIVALWIWSHRVICSPYFDSPHVSSSALNVTIGEWKWQGFVLIRSSLPPNLSFREFTWRLAFDGDETPTFAGGATPTDDASLGSAAGARWFFVSWPAALWTAALCATPLAWGLLRRFGAVRRTTRRTPRPRWWWRLAPLVIPAVVGFVYYADCSFPLTPAGTRCCSMEVDGEYLWLHWPASKQPQVGACAGRRVFFKTRFAELDAARLCGEVSIRPRQLDPGVLPVWPFFFVRNPALRHILDVHLSVVLLLSLIFATPALNGVRRLLIRAARHRRDECACCGYPRCGLVTTTCPECGESAPMDAAPRPARFGRALLLLAIPIAAWTLWLNALTAERACLTTPLASYGLRVYGPWFIVGPVPQAFDLARRRTPREDQPPPWRANLQGRLLCVPTEPMADGYLIEGDIPEDVRCDKDFGVRVVDWGGGAFVAFRLPFLLWLSHLAAIPFVIALVRWRQNASLSSSPEA